MNNLLQYEEIKKQIISIRGTEIILDRDLSLMYGVETRVLKQAVRRNINRFPEEFMFELAENEINLMVSQSVIPSKSYFGGSAPYAFTEQGVAMVSAVLNSPTAVQVSIQIMKAFVFVRSILNTNYNINRQLIELENKQVAFELSTNNRFDVVFDAISSKQLTPQEGIFFDGQVFDARQFVSDIIRNAKHSIVLIDNYIDDTTLSLFTKKQQNVKVVIYSSKLSDALKHDFEAFRAQYNDVEIHQFSKSHDRFLIVDDRDVYHIGASLKDLGRKWFAFSKMEWAANDIIQRVKHC